MALDIENVEICMQKNQLVNILRLIELDQQYTKKQEHYQFRRQQEFARQLADLKDELEIDDAGVRAHFLRLFMSRPSAEKIFIEAANKDGADDGDAAATAQTLQTEGIDDCFNSFEDAEHFSIIIMGVPIDTLKEWLTVVSKEKAQDYLNRVTH